MSKGLVFGKFMPLHTGHLALIDFALTHCDKLTIVLCHSNSEPITGHIREHWLEQALKSKKCVELVSFAYDPAYLPDTSVSSREVAKKWAMAFSKIVPGTTLVITSEDYGEYVAEYMGIEYLNFDKSRLQIPISANQIRNEPLRYWQYIADAAKPYFVGKVALVGTESTGKSTLAKRLAETFDTVYVPEMARDIIEKTEECRYEDLLLIAELQAKTILSQQAIANKLLFSDTELMITKSYSRFLFERELLTKTWIAAANHFDLYLFLEPDCDFVQDGTRLDAEERSRLCEHHKAYFLEKGLTLHSIDGDWENRHRMAVDTVKQFFHL